MAARWEMVFFSIAVVGVGVAVEGELKMRDCD